MTLNKTAEKWKRWVEVRAKRWQWKEASNPRAKSRQEVWMNMVREGNLSQSPNSHIMFNTKRLVILVDYTLSDSGILSYFLVEGSAVVHVSVSKFPMAIKLPDGSIMYSTHTCNLDIPWIPNKMTGARIVPGLQHSYFISTEKFCEAGCKVIFDEP